MAPLSTTVLNAAMLMMAGKFDTVDLPALRAAMDKALEDRQDTSIHGDPTWGHRTVLLAVAAQSPVHGAVERLVEAGIVAPAEAERTRLSSGILANTHPANKHAVARLLDEEVRMVRKNPAASRSIADLFWAWQVGNPRIQQALTILGLRPVEARDHGVPFRIARLRWGFGHAERAADALVPA